MDEVAVIGLPDDDLGEKITAVIVGKVSEREVVDYCATKLADFKKPRQVIFVEQLPRNAMSKVQKHDLVKQFSQKQP